MPEKSRIFCGGKTVVKQTNDHKVLRTKEQLAEQNIVNIRQGVFASCLMFTLEIKKHFEDLWHKPLVKFRSIV